MLCALSGRNILLNLHASALARSRGETRGTRAFVVIAPFIINDASDRLKESSPTARSVEKSSR